MKFKQQLEEIRDLVERLLSMQDRLSEDDFQELLEKSNTVAEALLNCR